MPHAGGSDARGTKIKSNLLTGDVRLSCVCVCVCVYRKSQTKGHVPLRHLCRARILVTDPHRLRCHPTTRSSRRRFDGESRPRHALPHGFRLHHPSDLLQGHVHQLLLRQWRHGQSHQETQTTEDALVSQRDVADVVPPVWPLTRSHPHSRSRRLNATSSASFVARNACEDRTRDVRLESAHRLS